MQLKPITILIGKNSSGKSAIAKLFPLFETSLMGNIDEPLLLKNNGVELGAEFDNLFFGNKSGGDLRFEILFENEVKLKIGLGRKSTQLGKHSHGLEIHEWEYQDNQQHFKLYSRGDNYYESNTDTYYQCKFRGFVPEQLINKNTNKDLSKNLNLQKIDVDYIGPFRVLPERYLYWTGETEFRDTGITGQNAYGMLIISKFKDDYLHENVGEWYKKHFDGWKLEVDDSTNRSLISIVLSKDGIKINIMDVGQGMNQALPLVVRANVKNRPNSMIILEQPELHLHPAAHGDLAELFAKSAKENNQTFIIETHSENILLRLRKLIVENDFGFTKDDLIIYWLEDAESEGKELREITVDDEGVLSDWPDGVFSEGLKEILEMQEALDKKEQQK